MDDSRPEREETVSERLASRSGSFLYRRASRRSFLARLTLGATALSIAPLRYLLRPDPAWAYISPGDCSGGLCTDGYTEFCCTINNGRNQCPSYSFIGGWWKCTSYGGSQLCANEGVRYYVDCNLKPGASAPGGCHCADDDCGHRRVSCNVFRYGQCNTQVDGVTPVVCRMVVCQNPATIPEYNCNDTYMEDDYTCGHESGCLTYENARIIGPNPGA